MPIKTALFIDFDNVYSNLDKSDPRAAVRFAEDPAAWLEWFQLGQHVAADGAEPRRLLLRRCYLNHSVFGSYRTGFVRAGCSVRDCPPLTTRGKNAADVWMTLDILDAIAHPTGFEEFIILASDADFTPVLLRLREHDRRTVLINDRVMAAALRAACDLVGTAGPLHRRGAGPAGRKTHGGPCTEPPTPASEAAPRERFQPQTLRSDRLARALEGQPPDLVGLASRLHAAVGVPALSPEQYHVLFAAMAAAIRETGAFDLVGRTVDRCRATGVEIGLRPVGDTREILREAGFDFQADATGAEVATTFRTAILTLCQQQGMTLRETDRALLDQWLGTLADITVDADIAVDEVTQ